MFDSFPIDLVYASILIGLFGAFIIVSSDTTLRKNLFWIFNSMLVFTIIFSLIVLIAFVLWFLFETQILGIPFERKI